MSKIDWLKKLNWDEEHVEDLKYTGYSYIRQGKYDIAMAFFSALIILEPSDPYNLQSMGAIYMQLNQPAEAMKYLERALKLEGKHGPTLLNLAKAFFMLGNKEEGLRIAHLLKKDKDSSLSNIAKALIMAYS